MTYGNLYNSWPTERADTDLIRDHHSALAQKSRSFPILDNCCGFSRAAELKTLGATLALDRPVPRDGQIAKQYAIVGGSENMTGSVDLLWRSLTETREISQHGVWL